MRKAKYIALSECDKMILENHVEDISVHCRLAERSRIILLASEGLTNKEIANELNLSENKVSRWRNRFIDTGIQGIVKGKPRGKNHGGKNSDMQAILKEKIIYFTTQKKPDKSLYWSTRSLAKALGTSNCLVHRVWKTFCLNPQIIKTFLTNENFTPLEKIGDFSWFYELSGEKIFIFNIKSDSAESEYEAVVTVNGSISNKKSIYKKLNVFLDDISSFSHGSDELHMVFNSYSLHKNNNIQDWIKNRKNIYLHFIPDKNNWSQTVESIFEKQIYNNDAKYNN